MRYVFKTLVRMTAQLFGWTEFTHVRTFHNKFRLIDNHRPVHLTQRKLRERVEFLQEELNEFNASCATQDLEGQADALIDLVYVAKGTAVMLGLPWDDLWDDVHRANMEKIRGVSHRGHAVDCIKPLTWRPPMTATILRAHGYNPRAFKNAAGVCREEWCHDDMQRPSHNL